MSAWPAGWRGGTGWSCGCRGRNTCSAWRCNTPRPIWAWRAGGRSTAGTGWTSWSPSGCWSAAMSICASPPGCRSTYHRIQHGDVLDIGGRRFEVLTGGGHALEQAMLFCPEDKLFFAADQVIAKISPNVSVTAMEPGRMRWASICARWPVCAGRSPPDVLVLSGHGLPFEGLHRAHRRADRPSRGALRADRRGLPGAAAVGGRHRAGGVPARCWTSTRPASPSARCWRM